MIMQTPKISVIIPVYNVESYLSKCIDSILCQTYTDFELLLVDDGSSDASGKICDMYKENDNRIRVFHKKNEGVSKARNLALNNALGEFVIFVDSDDWIEPNTFELVLNQLENFDILFFDIIWHYEDNSIRTNSAGNFLVTNRENVEQAIFRLIHNLTDVNLFGFTVNKIFRKSIIDKYNIRFIENLAISEDEIFTMEYCLKISSMKYFVCPLYHYIWKQQGLTHKYKSEKEYLLLVQHLEKFLAEINNKELYDLQKKRIALYLNLAAWSNNKWYNILKGILRLRKYCVKQRIAMPVVSIAREFLHKIR